MGVVDSIIVFSCLGLSGQQHDACDKALQAGSKQSGFEQTIGTYEGHQMRLLEKGTYQVLGHDTAQVMGATAWLTKSAVEKKASVGLPSFGLCTSVAVEINHAASKLVFKWTF